MTANAGHSHQESVRPSSELSSVEMASVCHWLVAVGRVGCCSCSEQTEANRLALTVFPFVGRTDSDSGGQLSAFRSAALKFKASRCRLYFLRCSSRLSMFILRGTKTPAAAAAAGRTERATAITRRPTIQLQAYLVGWRVAPFLLAGVRLSERALSRPASVGREVRLERAAGLPGCRPAGPATIATAGARRWEKGRLIRCCQRVILSSSSIVSLTACI